jgi:hypothetical protein
MKKWFIVREGVDVILGNLRVSNLDKNAQDKHRIELDPSIVENEILVGILIEEKPQPPLAPVTHAP